MKEIATMKNLLALLAPLLIAASCATAAPLPAELIAAPLTTIADGKDKAFGAAVAPAQSLDAGRSRDDRVHAIVARIAGEVEAVTTAFAAAPAAEKIAATKAAVAQFSPETARDGASRSFEGSGPSLSLMRQVLFVPAASAAISPSTVMQMVSQFERSPKTDDDYYEYSDPADLKGSNVTDLPGSDASWTTQARPPMAPGQLYALKKCRHIVILGWYCNTSLYQQRGVAGAADGAQSLITFLRPLPKGADNAKFTDDRAKNIVDGYTALYVVMAADNLVLVYNFGIQSKADAASQQSRLNDGHKLEYRQLVSRIEAALGAGKLPF
jgi:hypothetical protein